MSEDALPDGLTVDDVQRETALIWPQFQELVRRAYRHAWRGGLAYAMERDGALRDLMESYDALEQVVRDQRAQLEELNRACERLSRPEQPLVHGQSWVEKDATRYAVQPMGITAEEIEALDSIRKLDEP